MASIQYPLEAPGIVKFALNPWRPAEVPQENLVGAYRSIMRGRGRFSGRIQWARTDDQDAGRLLEAWMNEMDDANNSSEVPLREDNYITQSEYGRQTFSYTETTTTASVYSGLGAGAVLNKELPGYQIGCLVKHVRLNQVLKMSAYHRSGEASEENNVNVRFVPFVSLQAGDVLIPANTIRIRKRTGATTNSTLGWPEYDPWTFEYVEEIGDA